MILQFFILLYMRSGGVKAWVDKEILNMEEAAELFNVSVKTFIKLLKEEKVPGRKIGREWRFSRSALVNWLSSGVCATPARIGLRST